MFGLFINCFTVFYIHSTYFSVVVKTNTNYYAERWCAYIKAEYTSERKKLSKMSWKNHSHKKIHSQPQYILNLFYSVLSELFSVASDFSANHQHNS